jgi:hypothetical protein
MAWPIEQLEFREMHNRLRREFFEQFEIFGIDTDSPYSHLYDSTGNIVGREPVGALRLSGYRQGWANKWADICREREEIAKTEERYARKREELAAAKIKRDKRAMVKKELNEAKMIAAAAHLHKTAWIHF